MIFIYSIMLTLFAMINKEAHMLPLLSDWQIQFPPLKPPSLLARGPKQSIPSLRLAFSPSSLLLSPLASELISLVVQLSLWVCTAIRPYSIYLPWGKETELLNKDVHKDRNPSNPLCSHWTLQISAGTDRVCRLRVVHIKASLPQTHRPVTNHFDPFNQPITDYIILFYRLNLRWVLSQILRW